MGNKLTLTLPWPPSVNNYYKNIKGSTKKRIGDPGLAYRAEVARIVGMDSEPITGRIKATVHCYVPDYRKRDLDNIQKCLWDSLTKAGVYGDDSQIDEMTLVRMPKRKGGRLILTLEKSHGIESRTTRRMTYAEWMAEWIDETIETTQREE